MANVNNRALANAGALFFSGIFQGTCFDLCINSFKPGRPVTSITITAV